MFNFLFKMFGPSFWNNLYICKCICHNVSLKLEHFQAVQFLSQVKWSAATGTQRLQDPDFNTYIILFCICSKSESYVFLDMGVLQCWALKNVITFSTAGKNGRSKFYKILSFSVLTGLGFWQVLFIKSWFWCNTAKAEKQHCLCGIKEISSLVSQLCHQLFSSPFLPVLLRAYRICPDGNTVSLLPFHYLIHDNCMHSNGASLVPGDFNCLQLSKLPDLSRFKNFTWMTLW